VTDLGPAEIARRARPIPTYRDHPAITPVDIEGVTPGGARVAVAVTGSPGPLLLLFLSFSCLGCQDLWDGTAELGQALPEGVRIVIVTRGNDQEDPSAVADVAPSGVDGGGDGGGDVEVVMSSEAYDAYRVHGPPFLVVIDGGEVRTEGVAWGVGETARATREALAQRS
jgi:hypothetical protein